MWGELEDGNRGVDMTMFYGVRKKKKSQNTHMSKQDKLMNNMLSDHSDDGLKKGHILYQSRQ